MEAVLYARLLTPGTVRQKAVLYALAANALSFWAGIQVSMWIPGIA